MPVIGSSYVKGCFPMVKFNTMHEVSPWNDTVDLFWPE